MMETVNKELFWQSLASSQSNLYDRDQRFYRNQIKANL